MDRSRFDLWSDRIIAGLLFGVVVAAPLLMGALRPNDFFWIEVLTACACSVSAMRLLLIRNVQLFVPPIFWLALAFAAYAIARYWTADLEYVARKELLWVLTYLMIFFLALNHLRDSRRVTALFVILLVVGMGMSLFALRQHITGTNQVWNVIRPSYTFRGSGTFIYPNHFAGFLELLLPFGIAALFLGPFSPKVKLVIAYCAIWLVIGLYVSLSRAGWIAALLGFLILLPLILRNRKAQGWGFAVFIVLLVAGLSWELKTRSIQGRFETMTGTNPITDMSMRRSIWKAAWSVWRQEPVFGAGPGHFDYRFRPYRDPIMQMRPGRAHNDYLDVLADWGIAGAVSLLLCLALFFWTAAREWWRIFTHPNEAPSARKLITIAGIIGLSCILAHSWVDYQMHVPANAILALVTLAAVLGQLQEAESGTRKLLNKSRFIAVGFLIIITTSIGSQASKSWREQKLLDRATAQAGPEKIATLKRAFELESTNFETAYWIGECYRLWSWEGGDDYIQLANEAMQWYSKAAALNPYDPYAPMRLGMCLDWLKRSDEAEPYYRRALELDPKNHIVLAHFGWHYFQTGNYKESWRYFVDSYSLNFTDNDMAIAYFKLLQPKLQK
jgi:O-antigen ligase